MTVKKVFIELNDEELEYLKLMAGITGWTVENEIQSRFKTALHEEMDSIKEA